MEENKNTEKEMAQCPDPGNDLVEKKSVPQELTFGQRAVGLNFNPSNDSLVDRIKMQSANLIDTLHELRRTSQDGDVHRMAEIAIKEIQTGQMWGVKAATWK